MLTPNYPLGQFPKSSAGVQNFLSYKSYTTLRWRRQVGEQLLCMFVMLVAIALGKAQSSTLLWPELALGTYLLLFRGPSSLIGIALGEILSLSLYRLPLHLNLAISATDLLFFIGLYLSVYKHVDKVIASKTLGGKFLLFAVAGVWIIPWSILQHGLLPTHPSAAAMWSGSACGFFALIPAALIWEQFIPQKNQLSRQWLFICIILAGCGLQVLQSIIQNKIITIFDGIAIIALLFLCKKLWGEYGSSLVLAATSLSLALAWYCTPTSLAFGVAFFVVTLVGSVIVLA